MVGVATMATLEALRSARANRGFDLGSQILAIVNPGSLATWTTFAGICLLAATVALLAAAVLVARRGIVQPVPSKTAGVVPPERG